MQYFFRNWRSKQAMPRWSRYDIRAYGSGYLIGSPVLHGTLRAHASNATGLLAPKIRTVSGAQMKAALLWYDCLLLTHA